MKKVLFNLTYLVMGMGLAACSSWQQPFGGGGGRVYSDNDAHMVTNQPVPRPPETLVASSSPTGERGVGGPIQGSMDSNDRSKMSHALDKPPGNSTQWVNERTGTSYTLVPVRKVTVNNNPYCRSYNLTANRNGKSRAISGTACVSSDGSWEPVGG